MKLFGPVHVYVPVVADEVRLMASPSHTGELEPAVGVAGVAFTTTATVPGAEVHPFSVMVTVYVPASASVAEAIVGFCVVAEKPFGPLQLYVPVVDVEVRLIADDSHTGEFDPAVGADGVALITTFVVPAAEEQPFSVITRLYVPASASVAGVITGFCTDEVKLFGPVHV